MPLWRPPMIIDDRPSEHIHIAYTLFCVLVRPTLDGTVVRNSHTADNARQIERVQHRFLR